MNHWAEFAPDLAHLVPIVESFDDVLAGWSSYPQATSTSNEQQHLAVLVDNPWNEVDQWVSVYADRCEWWDDCGEKYKCTHDQLWAYLKQLPRRLHTFGQATD